MSRCSPLPSCELVNKLVGGGRPASDLGRTRLEKVGNGSALARGRGRARAIAIFFELCCEMSGYSNDLLILLVSSMVAVRSGSLFVGRCSLDPLKNVHSSEHPPTKIMVASFLSALRSFPSVYQHIDRTIIT